MSVSIKEYGTELISKIKVAGSQEEVKSLINNSIKNLNKNCDNEEKLAVFIDTSITHLETLNPMTKDASQWSNINMARIHLKHIKREFELTPWKQ